PAAHPPVLWPATANGGDPHLTGNLRAQLHVGPRAGLQSRLGLPPPGVGGSPTHATGVPWNAWSGETDVDRVRDRLGPAKIHRLKFWSSKLGRGGDDRSFEAQPLRLEED